MFSGIFYECSHFEVLILEYFSGYFFPIFSYYREIFENKRYLPTIFWITEYVTFVHNARYTVIILVT